MGYTCRPKMLLLESVNTKFCYINLDGANCVVVVESPELLGANSSLADEACRYIHFINSCYYF